MTPTTQPATASPFIPTSAFHPRATFERLAAGALAGLAGGLVLGPALYAILVVNAEAMLGPLDAGTFWAAHVATSIGVGLAFGLLVEPRTHLAGIGWAVAFVLPVVFAGGHVLIAMLGGPALRFDAHLLAELVGHAVYAVVLGAGYVSLRVAIRSAVSAGSAPTACV